VIKINRPGPYTASYIVYKGDDGKTYVKSGKTGQIVYDSTSDVDAIQYAVDNVDRNSRIVIKSGTYFINKTINVDKSVSIEGESIAFDVGVTNPTYRRGVDLVVVNDGVTVFNLNPSADLNYTRYYGFYNLQIWGGDYNLNVITRKSNAFQLQGWIRQSVFRNIFVRNLAYGFYGYTTAIFQDLWFENLALEDFTYQGIVLRPSNGGYNVRIVNTYGGWQGSSSADYFFYIYGIGNVFIDGLWILGNNPPYNTTYRGLLVVGNRVTISNVITSAPTNNIAVATVGSGVTISNAVISSGEPSYGAVLIDSDKAVLSNIIIYKATVGGTTYIPNYGIYFRDMTYTSGINILSGIIIDDATTDWANTTSKTVAKTNVYFRGQAVQ